MPCLDGRPLRARWCMAAFPTEDRLRQKRTKSEQAISLAMKNRWDEAAQVNRDILDLFPNEVDAYNRLGKALTELGRYAEARDAYSQAVKLDPLNGIASKNLQRLGKLAAADRRAMETVPPNPRPRACPGAASFSMQSRSRDLI